MQELNETVGGKLTEFITQINNCYPPEVVEFYSPNYSKTLLQKIDEYQPGKNFYADVCKVDVCCIDANGRVVVSVIASSSQISYCYPILCY